MSHSSKRISFKRSCTNIVSDVFTFIRFINEGSNMQSIKNMIKRFNDKLYLHTISRFYCFQMIFQGVFPLTLSVKFQNTTADRISYSSWMENLPSRFHNKPLIDIAIPGSHDSGSYSLSPQSPYSNRLDPKVKEIISLMDNVTGKDLLYRWSVTQAQTIGEQLRSGVRYLDMRISFEPSQNELYVAHSLVGAKLADILMQIKNFVNKFKKEIILLDFNHVYAPIGHRLGAFALLISEVNAILGEHLCPRTDISRITMQYVWRSGKQVLFFVDSANKDLPRFAWSSITNILSPFDKETFEDPEKWMAFLSTRYKYKRPRNRFYITQGVLLPHWIEMLAGQTVNATLKAWISQTASMRLVKWMKKRKAGPNGLNIIIADYIEENNFVPTVLYLNYSGRTPSRMHACVYVAMLFVYAEVFIL
ncbi:PI-PLC X domain-containing protein 3-like [Dendronephthya gigantea]|uniref:PI-PLC X domain-containing protein 3-like n=1 Tax=Dendronephthya gigantea TaxID=151771 RepID=UPI0010695CE5|nr:PI-PLC X domain-containing protein 3-like [Dendronephthya gigantea]